MFQVSILQSGEPHAPLNRNNGKLYKLQCSRLRILSPRFSFFLSIVASTGSSAFRLLGWRFLAGILLNSKRLYRSVSLRRLPSKTSCKWRTMRAQRWREILNILTADQNDRGVPQSRSQRGRGGGKIIFKCYTTACLINFSNCFFCLSLQVIPFKSLYYQDFFKLGTISIYSINRPERLLTGP